MCVLLSIIYVQSSPTCITCWRSNSIVYVEKRYEPDITLADITKAKDLLDWNPQVDFRNWLTKYKDNQN